MAKIKTVFIGTSDFAVPILAKLSGLDFIDLAGVITQPDRSAGRHQSKLEPSPVKKWASDNLEGINIFQPEKLKNDSGEILDETKPELIIVASYGQMIPENMLDFPKFKCLNVHASLLPDLRGAVPMPMAILKGYKKTGVSIPIMTKNLDDGDLIAHREIEIDENETTESLTTKSSKVGADLLAEVLPSWLSGAIKPVAQDDKKASYCRQSDIAKDKAQLKSTDSAIEIDRKVRAFYPWPVAWDFLRAPESPKLDDGIEAKPEFAGKRMRIFKAEVMGDQHNNKKNLKLFRYKNDLILRADVGWLKIIECQLEGKSKMSGKDAVFLANDNDISDRMLVERLK